MPGPRSVPSSELNDLSRVNLAHGLDAVVPNVVESLRAHRMKRVSASSHDTVVIASRCHFLLPHG
jgi:hypothetical protein